MNIIYAAVGSVTTATRLARELERRGVYARVVHTPSEINSGGCSYSVRVPSEARDILEAVVSARQFKIRRLYVKEGDAYHDLS